MLFSYLEILPTSSAGPAANSDLVVHIRRYLALKGRALSPGLCCVQINSVLKSKLSTFTRTQNAAAELRRRHQMKFSRENKP